MDVVGDGAIDDLPALVADAIKLVSNDGEDLTYVHSDHLGAPQKMTDKDRSVVWDASFLPFGEEDSIIGSAANDNRFPGQRLSSETGLHYNYVPDYDPTTGRYLQSDPIGLAGGINTYGYVSGNPVNYVDPEGKSAVATGVLVIGGAVIVGEAIREHCLRTNCGQKMADLLGGLADSLNNLWNEKAEDDEDAKQCKVPDSGDRKYFPAPKDLDAFPDAKRDTSKTSVQGGGGLRKRWKDKKGDIYEWDSQHGKVEKYGKRGKHKGEFDPKTGRQTKPAVKGRRVEK